jgi:probable F420-dependent oxidoreductase
MSIELSIGLTSFAESDPGSWESLTQDALMLERVGVDRLVLSEHVVYGTRLDEYARPEVGGRVGGEQPTGPDGLWLDSLTTLTWLAARTTTIRLGTNILLAALRPAAVLAKATATLDVLCGGRLDLGVGVGWQREEYDAVGLDFAQRGALLDRSLEVCRLLWSEREASFDAPGLTFDRIHQMPKPIQPGGVPIWVSGTANARVARRLARFGRGWIPWGPDDDDLARGVRVMRAAVAEADGDPDGFGIVGTLRSRRRDDRSIDVDATAQAAAELAGAGATDLRLSPSLLYVEDRETVIGALVRAVRAAVDG